MRTCTTTARGESSSQCLPAFSLVPNSHLFQFQNLFLLGGVLHLVQTIHKYREIINGKCCCFNQNIAFCVALYKHKRGRCTQQPGRKLTRFHVRVTAQAVAAHSASCAAASWQTCLLNNKPWDCKCRYLQYFGTAVQTNIEVCRQLYVFFFSYVRFSLISVSISAVNFFHPCSSGVPGTPGLLLALRSVTYFCSEGRKSDSFLKAKRLPQPNYFLGIFTGKSFNFFLNPGLV